VNVSSYRLLIGNSSSVFGAGVLFGPVGWFAWSRASAAADFAFETVASVKLAPKAIRMARMPRTVDRRIVRFLVTGTELATPQKTCTYVSDTRQTELLSLP
jgi:hypothetical protein